MNTTEKRRQFIINSIYWFIIGFIIFVAFKYGFSLIAPFLFAYFVAYLLKKPIIFISEKLHIKRIIAAIVIVILFYGIIGGLISLAGVKLFVGLKDFVLKLPEIYTEEITPFLTDLFNNIKTNISRFDSSIMPTLEEVSDNLLNSLSSLISNFSVSVVTRISGYATSLPSLLIKLLLAVIATFFITVDYDTVSRFLWRQLPEKYRTLLVEARNNLVQTLAGYGKSYALIMLITFLELSIGLGLIGVNNFILVAFLIALLDILPVLGTGGIMIPWVIISFIQGDFSMAIKLIIVYVTITIIRNIIEPKIIGNQVGLHPVATLFAMFVGTSLFGIVGLFGLPITLSLLKNMNDRKVIHIFK